jgi:membrane-bound lytic murein transglycosylase D
MIRQFLLLCNIGILFCFTNSAAQQTVFSSTKISSPDTTGKKDSLLTKSQTTINDLKQGFHDLFINSTVTNGVSMEQLNPKAISFVQDYIDKYGKGLEEMKNWGKPYFDMMDAILIQHGLPRELKYLAVIESHLKSSAVSWAGAVGPWQFMPAAARHYGLKVTRYMDERTDYYKSTHAAASYLKELFSVYGDWLLVIAAYNGGPGNVNAAIKKSGSKDFWTLQNYLPEESRNHVKKFIATHYIMEGQGGITTVTKEETKNISPANANSNLSKEELAGSKILTISGRYNSLVIVKYIAMDLASFNRYNPDFDKLNANNGNYDLRLPNDKMDIFLAKKFEILNESLQLLLKPGGVSGKSNR